MKQCHWPLKGMGMGISYVVIHVCVCKKFFQVLPQRSSARHPVVPSENLLPLHLNMLEYCLGAWSVSELKDRHWCTGLVGVCGEL